MSIRTALRESTLVTYGVLAALVWVLLTWIHVFQLVDLSKTGYLGQGAFSGAVGLLVMTVFLGLLVAVLAELTEHEPAPNTWPPRE